MTIRSVLDSKVHYIYNSNVGIKSNKILTPLKSFQKRRIGAKYSSNLLTKVRYKHGQSNLYKFLQPLLLILKVQFSWIRNLLQCTVSVFMAYCMCWGPFCNCHFSSSQFWQKVGHKKTPQTGFCQRNKVLWHVGLSVSYRYCLCQNCTQLPLATSCLCALKVTFDPWCWARCIRRQWGKEMA